MAATLDQMIELLVSGQTKQGREAISEWYEGARDSSAAERARSLTTLCAHLDVESHQTSAYLAMVGGALIETGIDAEPLARAVLAPLRRSLEAARRLVEQAAELPDESDLGECRLYVGTKGLSSATIDRLAHQDFEAIDAFVALETWYRPVVASWSRATHVLREVQQDQSLASALEAANHAEGVDWIRTLLTVLFHASFVILVPEAKTGYAFELSGCVDNGQLMILLSDPLNALLRRIGANGRAPSEMLSLARGEGPQNVESGYACNFGLYPWQAMDPARGLPSDGLYRWTAPGGRGDMSLPADFRPGDIVAIDGVRVLLLVGPKAQRVKLTRELSPSRRFSGLEAELRLVALSREDIQRWTQRVCELAPRSRG